MTIPMYSEEEWNSIVETATHEGIPLEISPGLPCSAVQPKNCMRKVTRVLAFLKEGDAWEWTIHDPLCREHAEQASKLYHTDAPGKNGQG